MAAISTYLPTEESELIAFKAMLEITLETGGEATLENKQ